ncbi:MAG: saccharopine dehydrogenase NADP-binding domain-containing protein [Reichenbachiella sp.]|uniref:saccharopine dehydrogenase NADP-binding domain-containing protein n=1 Tax=Reichenbachiella sp. TaxID=2184521 RepID=UPI003264D54F
MKKLLIMGGYGNVGKLLASYLLQHVPHFQITIAGRNLTKAKETAEILMNQYPGNAIYYCRADAANKAMLLEVLSKIDMVVVASSSVRHISHVAEAALETNTDYFDTQLSSPKKIETLRKYRAGIQDKQLIFITDGGFHPGVPGAMIHWAKQKLGTLTHARVYAALKMDWSAYNYTYATIKEMLEEFKSFDPPWLENAQWKKTSWTNIPKWNFGEPYGELPCTPMLMEEIRSAPSQIKELHDTGFFISGFNPIMDNFLIPILWVGIHILPPFLYWPLGRLFEWGIKLGKPPFGVKLVADCKGEKGSMQISAFHHDGYEITVIAIVACLKQYLSGSISTGLHLQAWAVEPDHFFDDMIHLGIEVSVMDYQDEPMS